jgi:DNA-binding CsgD family transcriptional regulator
VVLSAGNEVELVTPPAHELFEAMRFGAGSTQNETPPGAVLALAAFARGIPDGVTVPARTVAVPTVSGWITRHASLPDGATGRVAIVLERSATPECTAVRLESQGVSAREREVAHLLAAGLTNAERLVVSPYTVQDHIKSLFEKTNVSPRQELVARIFLDGYLPRIAAQTPLNSSGQFTPAG